MGSWLHRAGNFRAVICTTVFMNEAPRSHDMLSASPIRSYKCEPCKIGRINIGRTACEGNLLATSIRASFGLIEDLTHRF
jgi:hypothetical protein